MKCLYLLLASFFFCSCLIPGEPETGEYLHIMSWNVQNLFDDRADGGEYDEYNPESSDWDESKMRIKMEHLQEVLYSLEEGLPDILLLQEVENRNVLEILNRDYLDGEYRFIDAWKDPDMAVTIGILSRAVPEELHLHFPGKYGKRQLRPLLELQFDFQGERLVLINNHWKSRTGGQAATEDARILAASLLTERVRELREEGIRSVIAAGDFNGSWEDYRSGASQTAQMPVEEIGNNAWMDSLFITEDAADFALATERIVLFSPWTDMDREGSYFYQNRWMKLDHFFLDKGFFDGEGYEYGGSCVPVSPFMLDDQGRPASWESWRSSGYSDHLPLLLTLHSIGGAE